MPAMNTITTMYYDYKYTITRILRKKLVMSACGPRKPRAESHHRRAREASVIPSSALSMTW